MTFSARILTVLSVTVALGLLAGACAYLAGHAYFLVNKTMPHDVALDTWYQYWQAYSGDKAQRKHLIVALVLAAALVFGAPLVLIAQMAQRPRPLHGDARWANEREIRDADLL